MNLTSFFIDKCFEYLLKEDKVTSEQCEEGTEKQISPPWSYDPEIFNTLCTGCGACATACAKDLIILEEGGLPVMDFTKGFCHFCGDCARSCSGGALHFSDKPPHRPLHVAVKEHCLTRKKVLCRLCREQCEQEAIIFSGGGQNDLLPRILSEQCNGCGACIAGCPVQAVSLQYIEKYRKPVSQSISTAGDA